MNKKKENMWQANPKIVMKIERWTSIDDAFIVIIVFTYIFGVVSVVGKLFGLI
jgi:hypothetical protein